MNLLDKVLELDISYLDTFTSRLSTSWGYLFCNEQQPKYYDANHAQIHEVPGNPNDVINEVLQFYGDRKIIPRFYIYNLDKQAKLLETLSAHNFRFEELVTTVQIWNKEINWHRTNNNIVVEKVTDANYHEALAIDCSIKEFGGREIRENAFAAEFKHPSFTHYLLRYNGVACSAACIFEHENQVRMESVATLSEFRGKGLIGELIYFLQTEVQNKGVENFWVFPINERVEKVYAKYGFKTAGKLKMGHAFLHGKSVLEIREG